MAVATGTWAQDEVQYPIVYDFEAAAKAGENPSNKNGSAANGQAFYGWEKESRTDSKRQDYKGYEFTTGSVLPKVCHVWRRSDRIHDDMGDDGLNCPSNKEMAIDGLTPGLTVTFIYDATNAAEGSKELLWAIGDGSSASLETPRATATIKGVEAVPGETTIKSGDVIKVNSVTPAENGTGYIVVQIKKGMILKKVIIDVAAQITAVTLDEAEDNTTVLSQLDGKTADVTLQRTLVANYWNTLAVPFNVDATKLAVLGVTVKELTGSTFADGTLTLNFADATSIVAGKPYLVKVTSDFDFSAQALPNVEVGKELNTVETDAVDFIPTLGKTAIPEGDTKTVLFLAAGNTLKNPSSLPADIKGFRAYFQLKGDAAAARTFALNLGDGEATGIIATDYTDYTDKAGATFDLQGRKVQNATKKGVYIVNGKKVIK